MDFNVKRTTENTKYTDHTNYVYYALIMILGLILCERITINVTSDTMKISMILIIIIYILYVQTQRYQYKILHEMMCENKKILTPEQLDKIFFNVWYREFPFLITKALEFAFFQSYGIPSISMLLSKTKQFEPQNVAKRYDDTDFILKEFFENGINTERGNKSMKRLNYIHGRYKIKNE
eukprot:125312_1